MYNVGMFIKKIISIGLLILGLFLPSIVSAQTPDVMKVEYYRAKVLKVENISKEIEYESDFNDWQKVEVQIINGELKGRTFSFENSFSLYEKNDFLLEPNDQIVVSYQQIDGREQVAMADYVRTIPIVFLIVLFSLILLLITGLKGIRSLLGFAWIIAIFIFFLVPGIIAGTNVYLLVFVSALAMIAGSMTLLLGFSRKTLLIIISSLFGLVVSTILVLTIGAWANFSQVGLEETSLFNVSEVLQKLDLVAIVYAGMIIGALGSMMDISISIVAGIEEMMGANQDKGVRHVDQVKLFASGLNIGREIMAVNANTLILAYVGSALTVWVVAISQGHSWIMLSNFNMIFVEILRILAGTIGLFCAIPMTAYLASRFLLFERKKNF